MPIILQSPSLINDFADFLTHGPSPEEIVAWRPSSVVEDRYLELVEKNTDGSLAPDDERELEAFLNSEVLLSLLKARLRAGGGPVQ